ncbi:hypothetical protein ACFVAJ_16375 [Agromyces sp. NPDC057679]|uniref:hypothetical protein n=1 Tax=Agromyces sp. NPDC057679 TaxID=3346207 RepID=UPI00366D7CE4
MADDDDQKAKTRRSNFWFIAVIVAIALFGWWGSQNPNFSGPDCTEQTSRGTYAC